MRKIKFLLTLCFVSLFFVSFASSITFEKDSNVNLQFPCVYNGSFCAAGTSCYLSVIYPNNSVMVENQEATYTGTGLANYTLPDTSVNGDYNVPVYCEFPSGDFQSGNADFTINPSGEPFNSSKTAFYLGLILLLAALLVFMIIAIVYIDSFSWRMGLTTFAYVISNGFLLICWKSAELFLTSIPFIETIFKVLYIASTAGYIPMFLLVIVYYLLHMTDQANIETLMRRGFTEDQARYRSRK